jgi:tRNA (pseudouridine54-N1)-methyltransferase
VAKTFEKGHSCDAGAPRMRAFVILGTTARGDPGVLLDDLPGTSGRLDVLARCIRAGLCVSHGIRRDARIYLVMLGGAAPRTVRIDGKHAKFIRPDERPLATLLLKTLGRVEGEEVRFVEQRPGIAVACAGLEAVLHDLAGVPLFVLEEGGPDIRGASVTDAAFFIGDHLGFDPVLREVLASAGARPLGVGPVSLHSDDVVTVLHNELDRGGP